METSHGNRLSKPLLIATILLFLITTTVAIKHGWLILETAFAEEQTRIFDEMRTRALADNQPTAIASQLDYIVNYYPSGTKQTAGSRLDRVVERHRALVIEELIAHLRKNSGEDLGPKPEPWLKKFASH